MESNGRRLGGLMHSWSDGMGLQPASSAPLLSFISTHGHDGNAEKKVMYKNLVEMFPLGDTLMDQTSKPYRKHTSFLVYTPTPAPSPTASPTQSSRDVVIPKKAIDLNPFRGKKSRKGKKARYLPDKRGEDTPVENVENLFVCGTEMPRLSFSMDLEVNRNAAMIVKLKSRIDELEQELLLDERINKSQAEEMKSKEAEQAELRREVGELQKKLLVKEEEVKKALLQISEKEEEITCMHSLLEKAEDDMHASNLNMKRFHEESHRLHYQVAEFLFQMQSITSSNDPDVDQKYDGTELSVVEGSHDGDEDDVRACEREIEHAELTRRKYLGALIATRVNPSDEMLALVSMLRLELQEYSKE